MKIEIDTDDLWTVGEIATLAGVTTPAVSNWEKRGFMPTPQHNIKGMKLWNTTQVKRLFEERGIDVKETVGGFKALVEKFGE